MDFVRERRAWEERLKRKALELEVDDAIMDEVDQDGDVPGERGRAPGLKQRLTMLQVPRSMTRT